MPSRLLDRLNEMAKEASLVLKPIGVKKQTNIIKKKKNALYSNILLLRTKRKEH